MALVAGGTVEIGIFNISEIMPVKGVALAGPLPAELQNYIVFDAAIPKGNLAPEPAADFIKSLADPAERQAWQNAGLEQVGGGALETGKRLLNSGMARSPSAGMR